MNTVQNVTRLVLTTPGSKGEASVSTESKNIGTGKVNPGDFHFVHRYDKASPVLVKSQACPPPILHPPPPNPPPPPPLISRMTLR